MATPMMASLLVMKPRRANSRCAIEVCWKSHVAADAAVRSAAVTAAGRGWLAASREELTWRPAVTEKQRKQRWAHSNRSL